LIETDQQRRWWFATHPEFSSSHKKERSERFGGDDDDSDRPSPEFVDAWVNGALKQERDDFFIDLFRETKSQYGTESASKVPAEKHAVLRGNEAQANDAVVKGAFDVPTAPNMFDKVRDLLNYFEQNHPVFMSDPNRAAELAKRGFKDAAEIARVAEQIAGGHAYQKHVVERDEYPEIGSQEQFQNLIQRILSNPTEWKRLEGGKSAYWDKKTGTVVIRDPGHPDGGTAFRPKTGKRYYDRNLR